MISHEFAQAIADRLDPNNLGDAAISELRQAYPDVHFTWCFDDDVNGCEPAVTTSSFNLYLVDGREHCLKLTHDHEAATGLLLAELVNDD